MKTFFVRNPGYRCLLDMDQEARLGYLCFYAARKMLSTEEECELLEHLKRDPDVYDYIDIECWLVNKLA